MNQKFSGVRSRDWRVPDPTCPLQNLIRKTSSPQIHSSSVTPSGQTTCSPIKLKVAAKPISFWTFLVILAMHICRKFLYISLKYRLIIYFCSTAVVSLITDHFPPPGSFLSDPSSIINNYFVTYSWTLTCAVLAIFIYFTSNVFCCGQLSGIHRNLSRLIVMASWCYFCSFVFDFIEYRYSFCTKGPNEKFKKEMCTGRWISFAISNRTFQVVQSIIVISEEVKALVVWERLNELFNKKEAGIVTSVSENNLKSAKQLHEEGSSCVRASVLALTILIILLDVANISTIVYFNNMPQKIVALLFAVGGWILSYNMWFKHKTILAHICCPGSPGENLLIAK